MKSCSWGRTLLEVYPYLERVAGAIDKVLLKTALNSFNYNQTCFESNNVYNISNKLINLGERKITLINLKVLIEDALSKTAKEKRDLIIQKYIDKKRFTDIAEIYGYSLRTAFRKVYEAEETFFKEVVFLGYNDEKLYEMLKNEKWILNLRKTLVTSKDDSFSMESIVSRIAL